jgi:hypothetical protein
MIRPHAGPARRPVPAIEDLAAPMSEPSSRKSAEPEYGNRPGHPPDASDRDSREQDGGSDEVRRRWAFLAEASRCLADSLDYEMTIETVAGLALPLLGSWSIVDLTEPDGSISRLAIVHPDADKQEIARELKSGWPPRRDDPVGLSTVAQSGRSDLVDRITDDLLARVARNPQNLGRLRALGMTSVLTVPMAARGHVLGAITFISSAESRRFNDADISLATDLAHRCALAIDNARLHRTAQALVDTERARLAAEAADQIKSEFLATVSHEMRTPLNVIAGYLELLGMEIAGPLTKVQRNYVERIRSGEQQLLRIPPPVGLPPPGMPGLGHFAHVEHLVELVVGKQTTPLHHVAHRLEVLGRLLGDRRGLVVADVGVQRGRDRRVLLQQLAAALAVGLDPLQRVGAEGVAPFGQDLDGLQQACAITGIITFSSKLPCCPPTVTVTWFPITWAQTIISASLITGFTLPGMIELPGWIAGRLISARPLVGPLASQRMSLAILISDTASVFSAPEARRRRPWRPAPRSGSRPRGTPAPVASADAADRRLGEVRGRLVPVPTAVPPSASSASSSEAVRSRSDPVRRPARRSRRTPARAAPASRPSGACGRS